MFAHMTTRLPTLNIDPHTRSECFHFHKCIKRELDSKYRLRLGWFNPRQCSEELWDRASGLVSLNTVHFFKLYAYFISLLF